ncbi:MAG: hypothetical protein HYR96_10650 [Deltaproteobacteria bacterium]|nr:hypothetical protein [Deltaproteobacteria bacterium]MBI3294901.1 hypothetical protein [Deltaproteobacteria bacterium]
MRFVQSLGIGVGFFIAGCGTHPPADPPVNKKDSPPHSLTLDCKGHYQPTGPGGVSRLVTLTPSTNSRPSGALEALAGGARVYLDCDIVEYRPK